MGVPGRKSYFEELAIAQRYADLTKPAFEVLKKMLKSKDKLDQRWAVEQLNKAFVKMIPQDVTTGGDKLQTLLVKIIGNEQNDGDSNGVS